MNQKTQTGNLNYLEQKLERNENAGDNINFYEAYVVQVYASHSPLLLPKAEELISSYSSNCKSPFGNPSERTFFYPFQII
ncbi:hypothetical protein Q764_11760 [Flavobacterium suncheonense GH29-5 = DSM 17707]|uniref:Uncharacterized protein n=1 Tax=Flavobacterium suncheonense GH29-5 = DSM 17707 TaxID=1121899 RepID=A0A0A2M6N2_9FLAO|nr:hypothetical protein Q764_11760 [Flavobacterium suncheonense GH29-5 = DSM 17707]